MVRDVFHESRLSLHGCFGPGQSSCSQPRCALGSLVDQLSAGVVGSFARCHYFGQNLGRKSRPDLWASRRGSLMRDTNVENEAAAPTTVGCSAWNLGAESI